MSKKMLQMPRFKSESEGADWWASPVGRTYVKQRSAKAQSGGAQASGSGLVAKLSKKSSIQIALRLPGTDIEQAHEIPDRKGIGYQTLLKMLGAPRSGTRSPPQVKFASALIHTFRVVSFDRGFGKIADLILRYPEILYRSLALTCCATVKGGIL